MDLNEIVGGVKLVSEVVGSAHPDPEKVKTVVKAVALGYCKLLPKVNPKLQDMPCDKRFVLCGAAALTTVSVIRTAYQTAAEKISVEEGARNIANLIRIAIASIPKTIAVVGHVNPVFKAAAFVLAPVCKVLAPRVSDKVYVRAKTVLTYTKNVCRAAVTSAKKVLGGLKRLVFG